MAKRQQSGEFNPTQSIQPSQQITNQYITPSYFQMPQNEAIDIARSLSSLSPVLNELTGEFQRAMVETQVAEGVTALETASEEELDAALGMRWREAGLPEGASPIAQKAILAHAGKMKAKDALQKFRTENMDRFSDPMNTEDPREAMLAEFESLGISGFYATNAATEVYTNEANAFSEQVYQSRAARTAKQNRENLADDIYNESLNFSSGMDPSERSEMASRIVGMIQGNYEKHGFSGRDEAWRGISLAARELAKDDLDAATELINEMEQVEIGGRTIEQQFGAEISALEDDLIAISERAEDRERQDAAAAETSRNRIGRQVANSIYAQKIREGVRGYDPTDKESLVEIEKALIEQGVPEDEVSFIVADVSVKIQQYLKSANQNDEAAVVAIERLIRDDNITEEEALKAIEEYAANGDLTALTQLKLEDAVREGKDVNARARELQAMDRIYIPERIAAIGRKLSSKDPLGENLFSDEQIFSIMDELRGEYEQLAISIVTDPAHAGKSDLEKSQLLIEKSRVLMEKYDSRVTAIISDPSTVKDDAFSPSLTAATETGRERDAGDRPKELVAPDTLWDSTFTNTQREVQEAFLLTENDLTKNEGLKKISELRSKLYRLAKERAADVPKTTEVRPGAGPTASLGSQRTRSRQPSSKELNDYTRARSVTGISLEELTSRRLNGTILIDEETLNPKFFFMFDGIESLSAFQDLTATEEGRARITEVYEALPEQYQYGDEQFIKDQISLLRRYR